LAKVKIIAKDEAGNNIEFFTKTLTKEFRGNAGKKYGISIEEPNQTAQVVGDYTVQGAVIPDPHKCLEGEHWDDTQQKCVPDDVIPPPHECPDKQHWDEDQQKCVDDIVIPPGEGKILWKSDGLWNNGNARTMTDHHQYDPFDPLSEVAAGGHGTAREWRIPGDANRSYLSGGMSRVYTHTAHDGSIVFVCVLVWNKTLEPGDGNLSLEFYSRHNEGGEPKNRRGGVTVSFHKNSVESKEEYYHAVYTKGQSKDLPQSLEDGKAYPIKVIGNRRSTPDNATTTLEAFIDYGQGLKSVGTFVQRVTKQQEPGLQEPSLYWRWRVNGSGPKDVEVKDMVFTQL